MGCWGLSSCTEVKEGQQLRWRTCFTLTVGLPMDMARGVVWEGGGPCHLQLSLTLAVAKASWNALEKDSMGPGVEVQESSSPAWFFG